MRKKISLALVLAMSISMLTACGDPRLEDYVVADQPDEATDELNIIDSEEYDLEEIPLEDSAFGLDEEETGQSDELSEPEVDEAFVSVDKGKMRKELTVSEFTTLMGQGVNLTRCFELVNNGKDTSSTFLEQNGKEIFSAMREAGFDTVRIPVAWTDNMYIEGGDYTIDSKLVRRVRTTVEAAREAGLYVIINEYDNSGWMGMFGAADKGEKKQAKEIYKSIWSQVADVFGEYSDYVIFEACGNFLGDVFNEESFCDSTGKLSSEECLELTSELNQIFVDTVRKSGKKNKSRFLMVSGFNGDIVASMDEGFVIPEDETENRLLLSVKCFDPETYTVNSAKSEWGTENDYLSLELKLQQLREFKEKGVGVVISEYGVIPDGNYIKPRTLEYMTAFLDYCDIEGLVPVLKDDGKLYNIQAGEFVFKQLSEEMLKHSYSQAQAEMEEADVISAAKSSLEELAEDYLPSVTVDSNLATAWLMYASEDYKVQYCTGDVFDPGVGTAGIVAGFESFKENGTFRVSLDFTGTTNGYAEGVNLLTIGIYMGELYYPGQIIDINQVLIDGEEIPVKPKYYTYSEDGVTTRLDLYNIFSESVPTEMRTNCEAKKYSAKVIPGNTLGRVHEIEVEFTLH